MVLGNGTGEKEATRRIVGHRGSRGVGCNLRRCVRGSFILDGKAPLLIREGREEMRFGGR